MRPARTRPAPARSRSRRRRLARTVEEDRVGRVGAVVVDREEDDVQARRQIVHQHFFAEVGYLGADLVEQPDPDSPEQRIVECRVDVQRARGAS